MDGKKMEKGMGEKRRRKGKRKSYGISRIFPTPRITAGTVTVREAVHSQIAW
jgi:energy-converting hydrogenase Eha subunit A